MNINLLQLIQDKMPGLSKGQKLLAQYIVEFYDLAAFMTAAKLGKTVGISEATVVRFASELGFNGYPGLQKAMQALVYSKISGETYSDNLNSRTDLVSDILRQEMENLRQTALYIDKDMFAGAIEAIKKGNFLYIIGENTNSLLAEYLGQHLQYYFKNVHILTDRSVSNNANSLRHLNEKDVVIGVNFPQYSPEVERTLEHCRAVGATVIGFTDQRNATITKICNYVLFAKCATNGTAHSLVAALGVINAFISALSLD